MLDDRTQSRLESIEQHYVRLEEMMGDPENATDHRKLTELGRERAELTELVETYRRYKRLEQQVVELEEMRDGPDPELAQMARDELDILLAQLEANVDEI